MYFDHHKKLNEFKSDYYFKGKVIAVLKNAIEKSKSNIVILDQTCFYPTSGGQ